MLHPHYSEVLAPNCGTQAARTPARKDIKFGPGLSLCRPRTLAAGSLGLTLIVLGAAMLGPVRAATTSSKAQFSEMLNAYPVRPSWPVAGIDYAVGVPAGLHLQDPATLSLPGVTADAAQHLIYVTGDDVVLDSIDFSLEGGWGLYVEGANDIVVRCNFKVGINNIVPINAGSTAGNLLVDRTTIDGGGVGQAGNPGAIWALISDNGDGLRVEHSWLNNAPGDAIDYNGSGTLIVRRNLFNDLGFAPGAHPDSVQFTRGTVNNAVISYNTVYFPQPVNGLPVQGGEGLQVEAQLGGTIYNTKLENNTIVATGPDLVSSYLIAIRQDEGSVLDGITVRNNFMDTTGSYGPFYPPSGTDPNFSSNVDLVTGTMFPPP